MTAGFEYFWASLFITTALMVYRVKDGNWIEALLLFYVLLSLLGLFFVGERCE
jgi:hypothetical protein